MTKIKNTLTSMVMATPLAVAATPMLPSAGGVPPLDLPRSAGPVSAKAEARQEWQWGAPVIAHSASVTSTAAERHGTPDFSWRPAKDSAGEPGYRDQSVVNYALNAGYEVGALLAQPDLPVKFATLTQRDGKWTWTQGA